MHYFSFEISNAPDWYGDVRLCRTGLNPHFLFVLPKRLPGFPAELYRFGTEKPRGYSLLKRECPPSPLKRNAGGFRFPPFPAPIPLKTTKEGAFGPPSLESPPSCSTDSAPAAGAYSVTPPPHRPVWEETGRRCLDIGAGLSPTRRWFPRVGADAYIGPYERTAAASPRKGRTPAGLSLPYLPFSTLVGAAFMAARGRPQGSPLPLANNQAPASAPFGADAGANLTSIRTPRCPRCGGGAARHGCWRFRSGT